MLWHRLFRKLDRFFSEDWSTIAFQPVLYFFLWGAAIRLWINKTESPQFAKVIAPGTYGIWLVTLLLCPILSLVSWHLILKTSGKWRYRGFWFRLAADIGVFTSILAYHITVVMTLPSTEASMFSRYVVGSALIFVLLLIIRDLWALRNIDHLASEIRNNVWE